MWEEKFLAMCQSEGLQPPRVNARLLGYEVDFLWRPQRLVVETDGRAAHGTRAAFERDRVRDADLTAAGWRVVRITHRRLTADPDAVAALLRRLLGAS
jgi:very-short-patch-repair endonuclease